jgi:Mg2+/Co2+ transporter CorB
MKKTTVIIAMIAFVFLEIFFSISTTALTKSPNLRFAIWSNSARLILSRTIFILYIIAQSR